MTEDNQQITEGVLRLPLYRYLVDAVMSWEYGTIHSHDEISSILTVTYDTYQYRSAISAANKDLTLRGKRLKSVRNVGYMVLEPKNYLSEAVGHLKKSTNQLKTSASIAYGCKIELVELEHRNEVIRYRDHVRSKLVSSASDTTDWLIIAKKEPVKMLPRRD
jgi:hypothetical protein